MSEKPRKSGLSPGAAVAALHPITGHDHPIDALSRQRRALTHHAGRPEDEAALRDAWYLPRAGDDP